MRRHRGTEHRTTWRSVSQHRRFRFASIEAAAVAGLVCAVGWTIGLRWLLGSPDIGASDPEIVRYYDEAGGGHTAVVYLQVVVVGTLAFIWFLGALRAHVGPSEPRLFGSVFLGGGILLAGSVIVGASALAAPGVLVEVGGRMPDPDAAAMTRAFAAIVLSVFAPRFTALVMLSTATLGRKTGALPRWLVVVSYVAGVGELVNVTIREPTIYVFPAWIALVSVVLLIRRPRDEFEQLASAGEQTTGS